MAARKSAFKPGLERTLARREAFYRQQTPDQALVFFRVNGLPACDHRHYVPDYARMCQLQIEQFTARAAVDDDWVPMAFTHLGMGLFPAMWGSPIHWEPEQDTSWALPPFADGWPDDIAARLRFDRGNPMVDLALRSIRCCREQARGRFGVGGLEILDGLNMVTVLRGATEGFLDLYEHPDVVADVMDLAVAWNVDWLELQYEVAGPFAGGWCTLGDWLPSKTVWLSVDAYNSCRADVYVDQGRAFHQRLIDHFGAGWQHLHADGMRLLPEIVRLRNLVGIQIGEDKGHPRPFQIVRELQVTTGKVPLQMGCQWSEFVAALEAETLAGGVEYHVSGVPSVEEANRVAAVVREYRDWQRQ